MLADKNTSLKGPCTSDIAHGVSTTTQNQGWQAKALDVSNAVSVALHAKVEATQAIAGQTVAATLQYNSFRLIKFHDVLDDWLENRLV